MQTPPVTAAVVAPEVAATGAVVVPGAEVTGAPVAATGAEVTGAEVVAVAEATATIAAAMTNFILIV